MRYCSTMLILSSKNVTFECKLRVFGELKRKDSERMLLSLSDLSVRD